PPLAPRAHETLSLLLRHLALRGEEQRRLSRMRDAGGNAPALVAARLAAPRAAGAASDDARRHAPGNAAEALAFPYDATAPPPAGRRA
ncbi:MAG TPA: hypothetical protein VFJ74_03175, partial [Gemmatimonadaceae bacterium]|nr:hypothetical protein [Gemmatimonadaceae bacterium]